MPYKKLKCEDCGSTFKGWHNCQYCEKCKYTHEVCEECGENFKHQNGRTQRFCSKKCYNKHRKGRSKTKIKRVSLNCEVCGESYKVPESRVGGSSYCSKKCRTKKLTDTCDHCGREFEVKRCNKGRFRFCGRECEGAFKSRKFSGSNAPNWKGGADLYYGANWQEARRVVRNRDCFRCRKCGMHEDECDTELHVHHIVPLREFDEPEEANTPSNLVTVCPSCHGEVEGDVEAGRALL